MLALPVRAMQAVQSPQAYSNEVKCLLEQAQHVGTCANAQGSQHTDMDCINA